jgi:L-methionine (R)-S-oxide reductase
MHNCSCGPWSTGQLTLWQNPVDDVSADPRYLSGSSMVKCEIVVPILVKDRLAAELDIESYFGGTFTKVEKEFVESCATILGMYLARGQRRTIL